MSMQQTPEGLPGLIVRLAREEAAKQNKYVSDAALDRLIRPPPTFRLNEVDEVDVKRLRRMLRDIIELAPNEIGSGAIDKALRRVKCHYLWFC